MGDVQNELLHHYSMKDFNKRLKSFTDWQYGDDTSCSALEMAKAGFYRPNPDTEPDATRCFACCKEMEGWEIDDVPSTEHQRSKDCQFLKMGEKDWKKMTLREYTLFDAYIQTSILRLIERKKELKFEEIKSKLAIRVPALQAYLK